MWTGSGRMRLAWRWRSRIREAAGRPCPTACPCRTSGLLLMPVHRSAALLQQVACLCRNATGGLFGFDRVSTRCSLVWSYFPWRYPDVASWVWNRMYMSLGAREEASPGCGVLHVGLCHVGLLADVQGTPLGETSSDKGVDVWRGQPERFGCEGGGKGRTKVDLWLRDASGNSKRHLADIPHSPSFGSTEEASAYELGAIMPCPVPMRGLPLRLLSSLTSSLTGSRTARGALPQAFGCALPYR